MTEEQKAAERLVQQTYSNLRMMGLASRGLLDIAGPELTPEQAQQKLPELRAAYQAAVAARDALV